MSTGISNRNDTESPGRAQCSELLERIHTSTEFKRAARLREFLRYVGSRSLEGDNAPISEHEIGVNVFGRPQNYDTSADNIVRVNASEVRKRIAAYFATEGAHETILLDMPRGSYTPQFRFRPAEPKPQTRPAEHLSTHERLEPQQPLEPAEPPASATLAVRAPRLWPWLTAAGALVLALASLSIYLWNQNHAVYQKLYAWKNEPALGPFWTHLLYSPRQTDIVLADTSFALVEDSLGRYISLSDYLNRDYIQQIQNATLAPEIKAKLEIMATRSNSSLGDFRVAQKILAFDPISTRVRLQFARDYRPAAVKTDNVILIGSSRSNPWTSLFEDRLNFTLQYDDARKETIVINHHPQPGEQTTYTAPVDPDGSSGYSIVSYIPNQTHSADILIIAGTTSEATEAAGDLLTSEPSLRQLQDRMHVRSLPYFELLLRTTKLVGTPLSAEVIAFRTLPARPINPSD